LHDAEAARSLDERSLIDACMEESDDRPVGIRSDALVLLERENDELGAKRVLALTLEGQHGLRFADPSRLVREGAVLAHAF
jgi:hypothetical protein